MNDKETNTIKEGVYNKGRWVGGWQGEVFVCVGEGVGVVGLKDREKRISFTM
jgi:hypothetical protein